MSVSYQKPAVPRTGLRLHFNEHTGGCSPRVLEAVRAVTATDVSRYPDYHDIHARVASFFGVPKPHLVLTNGMDEGILAATIAQTRLATTGTSSSASASASASRTETIVPTPAFEEYAVAAGAAGAHVVSVPAAPDLSFPKEAVLAAITPHTSLVFLTSPGNPSGLLIAHDDVCAVANALPSGALLFLDEAYVDFAEGAPAGASFVPFRERATNVVIGRTFSKAYGLAGLRVGALIGVPEALESLARIVPPFSLNVFAVSALSAALDDEAHVAQYRRDVAASRECLYAACDRLGLSYWRSHANFVLIRAGAMADSLAAGLRARGIYVRQFPARSGCEGCIRITAGVLAHTQTCVEAMEDVLCARPR